ncbi:MAG TPA: trehalose-phosphatase [Acidimicrobiales bacterium]|nr:trehalose-phosphatase [Acidimicrobiales bacterium]
MGVVPEALGPLVADPDRAGLFVDYDGTLSEIVDDPAAARPRAGAAEALDALASRYGRVAVLSGRPVDFLAPWFGPDVMVSGLYGLETIVRGRRLDHPLGGVWREVVDDVALQSASRGPEGMRVEAKGLSLTLHYRGRPEREPEVRAWAEQQAARSGLELRSARASYELHPPLDVDKGTSLLELADDLGAVCFMGDDVGDLPAFDALDELATRGVTCVRVGVRSAEVADELLRRSDVVVDGPAGVVGLLQDLLAAS